MALDLEDQQQVSYFIHKMKSSHKTLGAAALHQDLQSLEDLLLNGTSVSALKEQLIKATQGCRIALTDA